MVSWSSVYHAGVSIWSSIPKFVKREKGILSNDLKKANYGVACKLWSVGVVVSMLELQDEVRSVD